MIHIIRKRSAAQKRWKNIRGLIQGFEYSYEVLGSEGWRLSFDEPLALKGVSNEEGFKYTAAEIVILGGRLEFLALLNTYVSESVTWRPGLETNSLSALISNIIWGSTREGHAFWARYQAKVRSLSISPRN